MTGIHGSLVAAITACAGVAMAFASPVAAAAKVPAETGAAERCTALSALHLRRATIDSAQVVAAGAKVPGARMPDQTGQPNGPEVSGLPEFCRVAGRFRPEAGSDIRFEVWLPAGNWGGRIFSVGNGGFAGSISYGELAQAVRAGHASAATDTGHTGSAIDSAWARGNPARVRDYGWRAIHLTAVASKQLVRAFYGQKPDRAYFMACSNGGRQALMEASRFPGDYDGIVAGAPVSNFPRLIASMLWTQRAQSRSGARLTLPQLDRIQAEVLRQCDGVDGQVDGLIDDPRQCRFDTARLACGGTDTAQCLSSAQVGALQAIVAGPGNQVGRTTTHGYLLTGAEVGVPKFFSWETWIVGVAAMKPSHYQFPAGILGDFMNGSLGTTESFDFATGPDALQRALGKDLVPGTNLAPFFARGGKLLMYHGWSDAAIPAQYSIDYFDRALRQSGRRAPDAMRLFMIPGMQHCTGGPGVNWMGQLYPPSPQDSPETSVGAAIVRWVEEGREPRAFAGARNRNGGFGPEPGPARQRLVCAWPGRARLSPGADPDRAASYRCTGG